MAVSRQQWMTALFIGPTLAHDYSLSYIRLTYSSHFDANQLFFLADQPLLGECINKCSWKVATDTTVHLWYHLAKDRDLADMYLHENIIFLI